MTKQRVLPRIYKTDLPVTVATFYACKTGEHSKCLGYVHTFSQHAQCDCPCHTPGDLAAKKDFYNDATYYGDSKAA